MGTYTRLPDPCLQVDYKWCMTEDVLFNEINKQYDTDRINTYILHNKKKKKNFT